MTAKSGAMRIVRIQKDRSLLMRPRMRVSAKAAGVPITSASATLLSAIVRLLPKARMNPPATILL